MSKLRKTAMKVLFLDIETAPHRVYAWGLYGQDIAINQIEEPGYTICFAAKWRGASKVMFSSLHKDGKAKMLSDVWELLDAADVVVHYNGLKFDIPTLNQEFVASRMRPPSPAKHVDLYQVAKRRFRLASNKLDFVATHLGLTGKVQHKGMELWRDCMADMPSAWKTMERYNKRDVTLLEEVYDVLLPWIPNHPNVALYDNAQAPCCPNCGSFNLQRRGFHVAKTMRYQRFSCNDCGSWSRKRTHDTPDAVKQSVMVPTE